MRLRQRKTSQISERFDSKIVQNNLLFLSHKLVSIEKVLSFKL